MNKFTKYLEGIVPFFIAEGIFYFVAVIILSIDKMAFFADSIGTDVGNQSSGYSQDFLNLISMVGAVVCGIVFFLWYRKCIQGEARGKLRTIATLKNIFFFFLLGVGCQFFATGIMSLLQPLFPGEFLKYNETINSILGGSRILVIAFSVFAAPIAEELIFRGVILHKTSKVITFTGANLLQAILFGLYHGNIIQGIYATILGFLLGLIYSKFQSIVAPILLHMIINASSFIIINLPTGMQNVILLLVMGVGFIFLPLMKYFYCNHTRNNI